MRALDYWPRPAEGLPTGQREVRVMPHFSDKPLRWAPVPGPIAFTVSVDGAEFGRLDGADWDRFVRIEQISDFHCVTTWSHHNLRWPGQQDVAVDVDHGGVRDAALIGERCQRGGDPIERVGGPGETAGGRAPATEASTAPETPPGPAAPSNYFFKAK